MGWLPTKKIFWPNSVPTSPGSDDGVLPELCPGKIAGGPPGAVVPGPTAGTPAATAVPVPIPGTESKGSGLGHLFICAANDCCEPTCTHAGLFVPMQFGCVRLASCKQLGHCAFAALEQKFNCNTRKQ
jgi:hypothetical protein